MYGSKEIYFIDGVFIFDYLDLYKKFVFINLLLFFLELVV